MAKSPIAILYDHINSRFLKYIQDGTDSLIGVAAKLRDAAGDVVNPATDESLQCTIDAGNSSTSQLSGAASFVGTGVDCLGYSSVAVTVHSDQDSATDGMKFQFSMDNSNWDDSYSWNMDVSSSGTRRFQFPVCARYFRVNYTNGATATTAFRCQTILHRQNILTSIHRLKSPASADRSAQVVKSAIIAQQVGGPTSDFIPVVADTDGNLRVTVATRSTQSYSTRMESADQPAKLESDVGSTFAVGGDSLTVKVDGGSEQTVSFATRAATAGTSVSDSDPGTSNGGDNDMKVSIDGGALTDIDITKDLTTGAAIAASIQTEIRANVPNGTNVTCDYDVTNPGRYTITSGTTGSSSSVVVADGGKGDVTQLLKLGIEYGGTETVGQNADTYTVQECADEITADLSGAFASVTDDSRIQIETFSLGTSASLQVTGGAANTEFNFSTTTVYGAAGAGGTSLAVDGSSTSQLFKVPQHPLYPFRVKHLHVQIRDGKADYRKFGGLAALTNGIEATYTLPDSTTRKFWWDAKVTMDMVRRSEDHLLVVDGWGDDDSSVHVIFEFAGDGFLLQPGSDDGVFIEVRDDLTDLTEFFVDVEGFLEL